MSKTAKIINEDKLVKKAVEVGFKMAKLQGFDLPHSSQPIKVKAVYLFLVEVNQITPLPESKLDGANIKKRLALWIHKALPGNDPLK
ncbi:DUF5062 family protein [Vibrio cyclitrophicus]|uniref:DUF5062 family protein n=1 Tax=Vibrio cyclitrophicus TaxID=47951 RepID=UPI000C81B364|nr:DUF5062 family protein [Vibrio cyclitrophicus]MCC4772483.1 DUF5062 family protein [Vibrio cyclitrophicus]MCC4843156.1 DUF5062 family protein [Vibrio cyclitrophicus]PME10296.1 DUF5062 domain-containing protein [Vibrio cyclitrophicus]PME47261.1 DUF5062 domain-containing protein [Vibrio cyclitrophicus]PME84685.1 DUF5062 domain-containing protein [Vibrio cyclitrophicus]